MPETLQGEAAMLIEVNEVMEITGAAKSTAYKIIKKLNRELAEQGYMTLAGKVNKRYLLERFNLTEIEV